MAMNPRYVEALRLIQSGRAAEAVPILAPLGTAGDGDALLTLGEMKWSGLVAQDPAVAREFFRHADEAGNVTARHYVTNLLASGIAGARDWPRAVARLREEARRDPARRAALTLLDRMTLSATGDPLTPPAGRSLSGAPVVLLFEGLLTRQECDYLTAIATPGYAPSTVYDSQRRLVRDPIRTSDGSTLHWLMEDPAVHAINRRIAAASGSDASFGEAMQILRYQPGQQYHPHFDFAQASDNQRVMTALVWLNAGYEGGETSFPETGLTVKGGIGDAIVFRNALEDRRRDPMSKHAGLPVTAGTKILGSRWIRERRWHP